MILGFKKQFRKKIKEGSKIHTVRVDKHKRWKEGQKIHFATGVRTKDYDNFMMGECTKVQVLKIEGRHIYINGVRLSLRQKVLLARNDGFDTFFELITFLGEGVFRLIWWWIPKGDEWRETKEIFNL